MKKNTKEYIEQKKRDGLYGVDWDKINTPQPTEESLREDSPYCPKCGTCGYIDCCGVTNFIEKHIKGKTDCQEEEGIISQINSLVYDFEKEVKKVNTHFKHLLLSHSAHIPKGVLAELIKKL